MISIPLGNDFNPMSVTPPHGTRIREVLALDTPFNSVNKRWRSDDFCHKSNFYTPSSAYMQNYSVPVINARFLPGEGKLFKIDWYPIPIYEPPTFPGPMGQMISCPAPDHLSLRFEQTLANDEFVEYKLLIQNNTNNKLDNLAVIYRLLDYHSKIIPNHNVIHSKLNLDCLDSLRLEEVCIVPELQPFSKTIIGTITLPVKNITPSIMYKFDLISTDTKPCNSCYINRNNNIATVLEGKFKFSDNISNFNDEVSVIPNPATSKIDIYFSSAEKSNSDINICDIYGASVYSIKNYMASEGKNSLSIDVSGFPVGVYNLIINFYNKSITKKFTVVR